MELYWITLYMGLGLILPLYTSIMIDPWISRRKVQIRRTWWSGICLDFHIYIVLYRSIILLHRSNLSYVSHIITKKKSLIPLPEIAKFSYPLAMTHITRLPLWVMLQFLHNFRRLQYFLLTSNVQHIYEAHFLSLWILMSSNVSMSHPPHAWQ